MRFFLFLTVVFFGFVTTLSAIERKDVSDSSGSRPYSLRETEKKELEMDKKIYEMMESKKAAKKAVQTVESVDKEMAQEGFLVKIENEKESD